MAFAANAVLWWMVAGLNMDPEYRLILELSYLFCCAQFPLLVWSFFIVVVDHQEEGSKDGPVQGEAAGEKSMLVDEGPKSGQGYLVRSWLERWVVLGTLGSFLLFSSGRALAYFIACAMGGYYDWIVFTVFWGGLLAMSVPLVFSLRNVMRRARSDVRE